MTAVADEGFVFAGWTASSGGSYSSATISFTMPQNADAGGVVLTAHFKADAHEHEYVEVEGTKTAATCLKAGSAKYKCKICGEIIEKDIKPLGHDWDDGVQKGAEIIYTCKREGCGETKVEAAKAHAAAVPSPYAGRDGGTNGGAHPGTDTGANGSTHRCADRRARHTRANGSADTDTGTAHP